MGIVDPVQERTDASDAARLSRALDQATRRVVGTLLPAPPPVDLAPPRIDRGMERTFVTRQQEADQLATELTSVSSLSRISAAPAN